MGGESDFSACRVCKEGREAFMALLSLLYLLFSGNVGVFSQKSMLRILIRGDSFEVPKDLCGQVYRLWKVHGKMLIHIFQGKQ